MAPNFSLKETLFVITGQLYLIMAKALYSARFNLVSQSQQQLINWAAIPKG
jgi:hypothetical protein